MRLPFLTAAGRLARAIAGATEDPGKHVGSPVDHIGVGVAPCRDQPDVFGNRRMRRARPLAIHHLVKVVRIRDVGRLHLVLVHAPFYATRTARQRDASLSFHPRRRLVLAESSSIVMIRLGEHHRPAVMPRPLRPRGADLSTIRSRVTSIFAFQVFEIGYFTVPGAEAHTQS
jgi:hypothetical protein